uniref:Uncharacterized protein n=1 Tax=Wuchereria bancrofti TaxID=6293 RepID=A0AAF5Q6B2_WUCBA
MDDSAANRLQKSLKIVYFTFDKASLSNLFLVKKGEQFQEKLLCLQLRLDDWIQNNFRNTKLSNYLERNLFPLRLLCYTQHELLKVPHGEKVDLSSCLRQFFLSSEQKFNKTKKCLYEEPFRILISPRISHHLNRINVVRSAPSACDYRNYIRETWKSDMEPDIPVIFVFGTGEYDPKQEAAEISS